MSGIDIGAHASSGRKLDHELPLVPCIDFLLCLVAFLLVTAVWSHMARLRADASLGVPPTCCQALPKSKELHVDMSRNDRFLLTWKEGSTVVDMTTVPRRAIMREGSDQPSYPDLARALEQQWKQHAPHRSSTDRRLNRAVLHTAALTSFEHVAAALDALAAPKRAYATAAGVAEIPAFEVAFATD